MNTRYTPYVIIAITCMILFVVGAGVVLSYAGKDNADAGVRAIGLMVGMLAPTVTTLVLLVTNQQVKAGVERIESKSGDIEDALNGRMDAKIRNNVHAVLDERENSSN